MLKVFWFLTPPLNFQNVLKTGEMLNMLKTFNILTFLSTFSVSNPFKFLTFLTFPQWEAFFWKKKSKRGGVKTQKTFNIFNIFNISPVLSKFFVGKPF